MFLGEVVKDVVFYDYDVKYIDNKIIMDILVKISDDVVVVMCQNVEIVFCVIGGLGLFCCDFFYIDKGEIFLNEFNIMLGFIQWFMYLLFWDNMGISYLELIECLVDFVKESFDKCEVYLL